MRTRHATAALLVLSGLLGAARAQQTIVVDKEGGGQFTEIQPAIDFAQPGDLILVKPLVGFAPYAGFRLEKSLRIVGGPGVRVGATRGLPGPLWSMEVANLPSGAVAVLDGLVEDVTHPFVNGIGLHDNQGAVHCRRVANETTFVTVESCQQVSFAACDLWAVIATDSDVLFTETNCSGYLSEVGVPTYALDIQNSRVTLAGGTWMGTNADFGSSLSQSALRVSKGSRLLVTGDGDTVIAAGTESGSTGKPAIRLAGGEVVLDPDPQLIPSGIQPPVGGPGSVIEARVPYLQTDASGSLIASLDTWAGAQAFLFVSPFVPPQHLPSPLADLWVGAPALLASGPVPPSGHRTDVIPLPPLPPGIALPLQSVVVRGSQFELSNPVVTVLAP